MSKARSIVRDVRSVEEFQQQMSDEGKSQWFKIRDSPKEQRERKEAVAMIGGKMNQSSFARLALDNLISQTFAAARELDEAKIAGFATASEHRRSKIAGIGRCWFYTRASAVEVPLEGYVSYAA
jgi:hypothetical protein